MDIVSKINGNTLSATEFNQIPTELENLITSSGQTVSDAVLNQDTIAVSRFAANNFYIDSGTADNYVLTLASSFTNPVSATVGYFVGMTIRFRAGNAGTGGAATVNVNGAGVKSLKEADGSTNPTVPNTIDTEWRYDGTVFRQVNLVVAATESVAGIRLLAQNAFYAYSSTNQTPSIGVSTKVSLNLELFDNGGYFDSVTNYRWTPPPGKYLVIASAKVGASANYQSAVYVYKNGSSYSASYNPSDAAGNTTTLNCSTIVEMSGTDYIELFALVGITGTTPVIYASSTETYLTGYRI